MSYPAHVLRLSASLTGVASPRPLPAGWALLPAAPTAATARVVADAFVGAVDFVGDEYEAVLALGADGGEFCQQASLALTIDNEVGAVCLVQLFDGIPEISYLCTADTLPRQGAARLLMSVALAELARAGHESVVLFVHRENLAAQRLCASVGFAPF